MNTIYILESNTLQSNDYSMILSMFSKRYKYKKFTKANIGETSKGGMVQNGLN